MSFVRESMKNFSVTVSIATITGICLLFEKALNTGQTFYEEKEC